MADTDPPDEVDDGKSPADGDIDAPNTDTLIEQVADGEQEPLQDQEADEHTEDPAAHDRPFQDNVADLVCQRGIRMPRLNHRCFLFADFDFGWFSHVKASSS